MADDNKHGGGAWIGGAILIAIGLVFLLQRMGYALPTNWWAIFLAVPGIALLVSAWRGYQSDGTSSGSARGGLVGGAILVIIAIALFFGVDLGAIWPILLILLGVVVIAGNYWRRG
jgi:hypothetical protein